MSHSRRDLKRKSIQNEDAPNVVKKTILKSKATIEEEEVVIKPSCVDPGIVLVFGEGDTGQLGLGSDELEKPRPTVLPNIENIIAVAAGGMHSVLLTSDHKVITFGCNDEGALGRDTSQEGSEAVPGEVDIPGKVVQVSAGDSHTAALLDNGMLYVWGTFRDIHGAMGLLLNSSNTNLGPLSMIPKLVKSKVKFKKVASGSNHLVLLGTDGNLYTCGCGEQGQLGRISERSANRMSRRGLASLLTPTIIRLSLKKKTVVVDCWAGCFNTFAKDRNGDVYVFGLNNFNQLGEKEGLYFMPHLAKSLSGKNWVKICGGEHHTLALDENGDIFAIGRKEYGRLGLGDISTDATVPTKIEVDNKKFKDISCGTVTSFAVSNDGKLYSWGMASSMLGQNDEEDRLSPTLVKGKQLENKTVLQVAGGGQHTVLLVKPTL